MRTLIAASFTMTLLAAPPPETRKDDTVDILHGVSVPDPYRWLEDQNSPETRAWLKAQMEYTTSFVKAVPQRPAIVKRLTELMRVESQDVFHAGNYFFFMKRTPEQDQPVLLVRHGATGKDEVLIDPNLWGGSKSISVQETSPDGKLLAYGIRKGGEDEVEVHFLNVETKKEFGDVLPRGRYFSAASCRTLKASFIPKRPKPVPVFTNRCLDRSRSSFSAKT